MLVLSSIECSSMTSYLKLSFRLWRRKLMFLSRTTEPLSHRHGTSSSVASSKVACSITAAARTVAWYLQSPINSCLCCGLSERPAFLLSRKVAAVSSKWSVS